MSAPDDASALAAGRRRATTLVAWLVLLIGAAPLYGVLYQVLPDYLNRGQASAGPPGEATGQTRQAASTAPAAAPAAASAAVAASAPVVRHSTDFLPKEAAWSRALRQTGADAATRGGTIAGSGNGAGAVACVSCHAGAQGGPATPAGAFPQLTGLSADYLAKQLFDYRDDRRVDPVMGPIAKALKDDEIAAVARYYATRPAPTITLAQGGESRAQTLHAVGDNGRALPACANCHGVGGEGQGFLLPRLVGQPADYLAKQLEAFRAGTRHNDDDGAMRGIAQRLDPADAQALAAFYASGGVGQPARAGR